MRKMDGGTQWGRLTASTSNIRASNYSTRTPYTSRFTPTMTRLFSLSSYRYSPSSSTYVSTGIAPSPSASHLPSSYQRYSYTPSSSSQGLSLRAKQTNSVTTRPPPYSPSTYSSSTLTTPLRSRDVVRDTPSEPQSQASPTIRSRSTSAISYRLVGRRQKGQYVQETLGVAAQQAGGRASSEGEGVPGAERMGRTGSGQGASR